jgi:hypothetical protein
MTKISDREAARIWAGAVALAHAALADSPHLPDAAQVTSVAAAFLSAGFTSSKSGMGIRRGGQDETQDQMLADEFDPN